MTAEIITVTLWIQSQVQEHQKLMVDFPEYPNVLIRMLNSCIKEPHRS